MSNQKVAKSKTRLTLFVVVSCAMTVLTFQNCGGFKADPDFQSNKIAFLASRVAFASSPSACQAKLAARGLSGLGEAEGYIPGCPAGPDSTSQTSGSAPTPSGPASGDTSTSTSIPGSSSTSTQPSTVQVGYSCQITDSVTLKSAERVTFSLSKVLNASSYSVEPAVSATPDCAIDSPSILTDLINTKTLNLSGLYQSCQNQFPNFDRTATYRLDLIAHRGGESNNLTGYMIASHFTFYTGLSNGVPVVAMSPINSSSTTGSNSGRIIPPSPNSAAGVQLLVLYEDRLAAQANGEMQGIFGDRNETGDSAPTTETTGACDFTGDPLVIQMADPKNPNVSGITMTAVLDGVLFDLLGKAAFGGPHSPVRTAWLSATSRQSAYFLVKPNASGRVLGIDELFGNNTVGPDGKMSANGFEALHKFDGLKSDGRYDARTRDGVIDARDAVFSQLRLWADLNGDGVAQAGELHRLGEFEITELDLNYDPRFAETDQYGNQVKFKSVAKTANGSMHLMFDLWFRYF